MIAEDQAMVRQALVALLELRPDIEVVALAADGHEAIAMYRPQSPLIGHPELGARNRAEAVAVAQQKGWL
jgi:chemotaxis response regulator CheB